MYLRKWSPVKYLMYLWLAILVWMFLRCDTAATMHLAPPPDHSSGLQGSLGGHSDRISSNSISSSGSSYISDSSRTPSSINRRVLAVSQPLTNRRLPQQIEELSGGPIPPRLDRAPHVRSPHLSLQLFPQMDSGTNAAIVSLIKSSSEKGTLNDVHGRERQVQPASPRLTIASNKSNPKEPENHSDGLHNGQPVQPNLLRTMFISRGDKASPNAGGTTSVGLAAIPLLFNRVTVKDSSISNEQREQVAEIEAERALQLHWAIQSRQKSERRQMHRRRWQASTDPGSQVNRNRRDSTLPGGIAYGEAKLQQTLRPQRRNGPLGGGSGGPRRYCSARDPATLAFEAPIVCEAKVKSMSDRRPIFAATFEILAMHKLQPKGRPMRGLTVRLQFNLTTTNECDIFRGKFRERGFVREELELGKVYFLFLKPNVRYTNFTILGQPIRKTKRTEGGVLQGVNPSYGTRSAIHFITPNVTRVIGKRVRLVCKVGGQPPPKVAWFKDKRMITRNATKYAQVHLKKRSELIIFNASAADTGDYECRAKNRYNNSSAFNSTHVKIILPKPAVPTVYSRSCTDGHREVFCHNGGTCLNFDSLGELGCSCPEGFSGLRCESKDSNFHPTSSNKQQDCTSQRYAGYYC